MIDSGNTLRATALIASLAILGNCAAPAAARLPAPPDLEALWEGGGAHAAAAVTFSYELRFPEGNSVTFDEVGLRLDDFDHVWVRRSPGDALTCLAMDSTPGSLVRQLSLEKEHQAAGIDFALRSIRLFFSVALTSTCGPWEYRSLLRPPTSEGEPQLELAFRGASDPHGACLLVLDPREHLPRRIVYRGRHPFVPGQPSYATFSEYEEVQGVPIAALRRHRAVTPPPHPRDPFPERGPPADPVFLEESVTRVRFLRAPEADNRLVVPEAREDAEEEASPPRTSEEKPATAPDTARPGPER